VLSVRASPLRFDKLDLTIGDMPCGQEVTTGPDQHPQSRSDRDSHRTPHGEQREHQGHGNDGTEPRAAGREALLPEGDQQFGPRPDEGRHQATHGQHSEPASRDSRAGTNASRIGSPRSHKPRHKAVPIAPESMLACRYCFQAPPGSPSATRRPRIGASRGISPPSAKVTTRASREAAAYAPAEESRASSPITMMSPCVSTSEGHGVGYRLQAGADPTAYGRRQRTQAARARTRDPRSTDAERDEHVAHCHTRPGPRQGDRHTGHEQRDQQEHRQTPY
jgi:hypothetical protein